MASWRCLHAGGSFGRVQVILSWTLDNWKQFDAWCCVRGIDPLELPSYRFYNLSLYALMEEKPEEQQAQYEGILQQADKVEYPILALRSLLGTNFFRATGKKPQRVSEPSKKKYGYVPSWWRGEEVNAKVAKGMMTQLPR